MDHIINFWSRLKEISVCLYVKRRLEKVHKYDSDNSKSEGREGVRVEWYPLSLTGSKWTMSCSSLCSISMSKSLTGSWIRTAFRIVVLPSAFCFAFSFVSSSSCRLASSICCSFSWILLCKQRENNVCVLANASINRFLQLSFQIKIYMSHIL